MPFNNTEYLYLELCTKIVTVTEGLTLATTSDGFYWKHTRKVEVLHQHFILIYTSSSANLEILEKSRLTIISNRIRTDSITFVSFNPTSSKEIKKGINKPFVSKRFIAEILVGLHNKDPPYILNSYEA